MKSHRPICWSSGYIGHHCEGDCTSILIDNIVDRIKPNFHRHLITYAGISYIWNEV